MTFDEFLNHRLSALLRFATVITCDPHVAQDVVQEVLVRAHVRWNRIGSLDQPEAYLKRMVVNEFLSWRRRSLRAAPYSAELINAVAPPTPDHAVRHGQRDELIRRIRALPPRQRAVLALRFYEGMSDPEIAGQLGCAEGTVRGHASRGLAALRAALTATKEWTA